LIPFLNYSIIENRINNKEMHFSLLFGLYALSEILKPYSDYSIVNKFKTISLQFIELSKLKRKINDIQLIEAFYLLSHIGKYSYI